MIKEIISIIFNVGLTHYLILGSILFCIGILGLIISKNIIRVLMSIEIMLCAVNINFAAFANFVDINHLQGQVFAVFVIAVAAAEAALGLAILLSLYRNKPTVDTDEISELKG